MKKFIVLLSLSFSTAFTFAQTKVLPAANMHRLDTIIYLKSVCRNDYDLKGFTYCFSESGDLYLNYYHQQIHGDTFRIIRVSSETYQVDSIDIVFNKRHQRLPIGILGFCLSTNKLAILFYDQLLLAHLDQQMHVTKVKYFPFKDGIGYQNVRFINPEHVLLARSYNYQRHMKEVQKTKLTLIDAEKMEELQSISPYVANLAMSHMSPYSTLSFSDQFLMVGQNISYQATLYDTQLKPVYTIQRADVFHHKNTIDSMEIKKIELLSNHHVSGIIKYLQPKFKSAYAFADGYFFVNNQTLLIRYALGDSSKDTIFRYFDVWRYHKSLDQFVLSDTTYQIRVPFLEAEENPLIEKENYAINFWLNPSCFTQKHTFVFSKGTDCYPIGKSRKVLNQIEKEYYAKQDAVFSITLLKNRF